MNHNRPVQLKTSKMIDVRFSEVDAMNIVWHGSYALYFEDAREQFGKDFGLSYMSYFDNGYYAPLVELTFNFKKPLLYEQKARIDIIYRNVPAAKVIFDYEIWLTSPSSKKIQTSNYPPLERVQTSTCPSLEEVQASNYPPLEGVQASNYPPLEGVQGEVALIATGSSTQVFLDQDYNLVWTNPPFYEAWKRKYNLL